MASKKQENKSQATQPQETSKEVAPVLPEYMKQFLAQTQADTSSLVASSVSVPRLSYRGKRWRFIVDGEEELVKSLTVPVIIVGVEPDAGRFIKTYYINTYAPGDTSPPDCSSSNGLVPDLWVSSPQNQRCQNCPKNAFGSAVSRSGGKAKACHDSKRLWVTKADDLEIVYGLNVPIMSLKNLAEYGKYIARNNYPLSLVITELSMDDESEFPKLCFLHVGFVAEEFAKDAMDLNQRRPWKTDTPIMLPDPPPVRLLEEAQKNPTTAPIERKAGTESINSIVGNWE